MKLKLNEAVQPIKKYEGDINRKVLPTLKKMGFDLPKHPKVYNDYIWNYSGYYKSDKGNPIPVKISFSTASEAIDEELDNAFMQMDLLNNHVNIGGVNLKDASTIEDAINSAIEEGSLSEPNSFADNIAGEELYDSKNGKVSKTREEWHKDFMRRFRDYVEAFNNQLANPDDEEAQEAYSKEFDNFYRSYLPNVYPDELDKPKAYIHSNTSYQKQMNNISLKNYADKMLGKSQEEEMLDLSDRGIKQDLTQYDQNIDWSNFDPNKEPDWDNIQYFKRGEKTNLK